MIRYTKMLLVLAVALWGLLGGLGNLMNYQEGANTVTTVIAMDTVPGVNTANKNTVPSTIMVALGFMFIWGLKLVGGSLCLVGLIQMWRARRADTLSFREAKRWAIAGCGVMFFMLFFGFSLIAVGPYKLYLSPLISAVELAALFAGQVGIVMLFLNQSED